MSSNREEMVEAIKGLLMCTAFRFDYVVRKKPKGIKIEYEVTQEQLDEILKRAKKGESNG